MFSALKQMAKMDGEGEDKGQLNYHVILIGKFFLALVGESLIFPCVTSIENMHHFVAEMSQLDLGSVAGFLQRAQAIYDENLIAYVKLVLRRPFAKIIVRQIPYLMLLSKTNLCLGLLRWGRAHVKDYCTN